MKKIRYHCTGKQKQRQSDLLVLIYSFPAVKQMRNDPIGTLALTPNSPSHILNPERAYRDWEALKTIHNFVILYSSSNHFGIPKGIYKTAKLGMHLKKQLIKPSGDKGGNQPCMKA